MKSPTRLWRLLPVTAAKFLEHDGLSLAAALAFYTLLSLPPLLVFLLVLVGAVSPAGQAIVVQNFTIALGSRAGEIVRGILENAALNRSFRSLSSIISAVVLFVAAAGMFGQLQSGLNRIWEVRLRQGFRLGEWLRRRATTFLMVIIIGVLVLAGLLVNTVARFLVPANTQWLSFANLATNLLLFTVLLALLYKMLPDTVTQWRDVWVGAAITSLLLALGRWALAIYLRYSSVASLYGAAGSLVVLLIILYYSSAILYFGAAFTRTYARSHGHPIVPRQYAEWAQE